MRNIDNREPEVLAAIAKVLDNMVDKAPERAADPAFALQFRRLDQWSAALERGRHTTASRAARDRLIQVFAGIARAARPVLAEAKEDIRRNQAALKARAEAEAA